MTADSTATFRLAAQDQQILLLQQQLQTLQMALAEVLDRRDNRRRKAQRPPVLAAPLATPAPPPAPALTAVTRPARLRGPARPTSLPSFWNWRHSAARSNVNATRSAAFPTRFPTRTAGRPTPGWPRGPPGCTVGNADGGSVTGATCGRQSLFLRGWSSVDIHPIIHWRSYRRLRQLYPRFSRI